MPGRAGVAVRLSPAAVAQTEDIWLYTEATFGATQADAYVGGLNHFLETLSERRPIWRPVPRERLAGAFVVRYEQHFVFFRELPSGALGVLAVQHQARASPQALKDVE